MSLHAARQTVVTKRTIALHKYFAKALKNKRASYIACAVHYDLNQTKNLVHVSQHVTEGKTEGTRRRERKRKQLPHGIKVMRRYWKFKDGTV
jgi:hypothetical protein